MQDNPKIIEILENTYRGEKPALHFKTPFELLIAVILSAQCTDVRVNKVTDELFKTYNTPESIAAMGEEELSHYIKSCGFYQVKSRNIIATCKKIIEDFGGEVPQNMEELITLPGVGRKTANVVMSVAFGKNAFAVDTHVFRVSHRLGFSQASTPEGVEKDLNKIFPEEKWSDAHHWLIWHGRRVCSARKPKCAECVLKEVCISAQEFLK